MPKSRTYHDPIHGAITLEGADPIEEMLIRLIDTPEFQRLRRIRQLDTAFLTFHGAEGSRFTHSLGVMALTRRAFDTIADRYPQLQSHRAVVLASALLHDLGHGPFSHAGEEIFHNHHEQWTCRLITNSSVTDILQSYDPDLPHQLIQVMRHQYPLPFVYQLVSSQIDCDRLDYLQRDGYFTGAQYGHLDLDRILLAITYDPHTQELVITRKGLVAIEHYLTVRYFMYNQVYNHPKNLAARFTLGKIFQRAQELLRASKLTADPVVTRWLLEDPNQMDVPTYLDADDTNFLYAIKQWRHHPDPILADLCRRYLDRDIFKAKDISALPDLEQQLLLHQTQELLDSLGYNPEFYCGIRTTLTKGYTLYQGGIPVLLEDQLVEISQISPLINALTQPNHRSWLIHPRLPKYPWQ
ncbi:MAG: HD domain-containing protein [Pseudanabaenaceae cyanobacterium SKYGB_i_bin29]|nr:HD domain-containing protein [Pseudanabaenaceae cyanobacterium SKYGB_i_bin29]